MSFWKRAYLFWIEQNIVRGSSESIQPMRERLLRMRTTSVKIDRVPWMMGDSWHLAVSGNIGNTSERYLCLMKLFVTAGDKKRWTSSSCWNMRKITSTFLYLLSHSVQLADTTELSGTNTKTNKVQRPIFSKL